MTPSMAAYSDLLYRATTAEAENQRLSWALCMMRIRYEHDPDMRMAEAASILRRAKRGDIPQDEAIDLAMRLLVPCKET